MRKIRHFGPELVLVVLGIFVPLYLLFWGRWQGGQAMGMETTEPSVQFWKSSWRKLARFFKRSRDQWKAKYMDMKKEHKLMGNQVRAVEKSRQNWRQVARQAQQQLRRLQGELEEHKKSATT